MENKTEKKAIVGNGKEISPKFTEICIYLDDIPFNDIKTGGLSGKRYVVLKLVRMKEKGKYGDTHVIYLKDQIIKDAGI